ncbi:MAG: S9 family peptidase [Candidatus Limnocylindrales bacterium]
MALRPARPPMLPADIRHQVVVEELDLAADGAMAVVVRRIIRGGRYLGHLLAIPLAGGRAIPRPQALTAGAVRDTRPRLSPDGLTVAFVRSDPRDDDALAALCLVSIDGGTPRRLRRGVHGGVGEIAWSPDGTRLAFTAEVDPPRFLVGPVARVGTTATGSPRARHIMRTDWRWDEEGHRDRWSHLFVVDARPGAKPRQVTSGDWGVSDIAWHPDGRTVAFSADRGPEPDLVPRTTIWAVDVDADATGPSAEPREVLAAGGWANHPAFSPDGGWVAAIGVAEPEPLDDVSPTILVAPADGSRPAEPVDVLPGLDRPVGNWVDSDLTGWMVSGRHGPWWADDRTIVATISDRGRSHPYAAVIDASSGSPVRRSRLVDGDIVTHTIAVGGGVLAYLATDGVRAMELHTLDLAAADPATASPWRRTRVGSAWQDRFAPIEMRLVQAPGSAGPIDTWIASPAGAGEALLPTIVDVHGGPLGAWAPSPHVEVILLASAGYRVVLPNIRGSATYGRDWIRPQLGDWGGVDAADVHAALDHVVALGIADPERLGVMGLSYGGFMVNWLVGTTDRFRAAVSENGVTNQVSDWANSDSGPEYDRASLLGDPYTPEGVAKLWRQSPLRHVANVRTPLLMLQAEADLRCPPYDNEQFFIALRHLRRTVEFVLYPDESHVYASSGRPDRRIDRNERILAWFGRYLKR